MMKSPPFVSFNLFATCLLILQLVALSQPASATLSIGSLKTYQQLELPHNVVGPETIAFDCRGKGPYVGVSDGRILKWEETQKGWTEFAFTSPTRRRDLCDGSTNTNNEPICGRPLGMKFNPTTCELYIADAYFGLMRTGPNGGQPQLIANSAEGVPFHFLNALDIDNQNGMVYFTDTSLNFQRSAWILSVITGDRSGRLMRYDPRTNTVTVILNGLAFPNGVALSKDKSFLILTETGKLRVLKIWLRGPKVNAVELFAQLDGLPDNVKKTSKGEYWVAMNTPLGEVFQNQPDHHISTATYVRDPRAAKYDEDGRVLEVLDGKGDMTLLGPVSDVEEHNGMLWFGSVLNSYVGVGVV